ncbi:Acetyl-CoA:acetoacetyl-CoA transferase, alpha subunit [Desulfosporosinus sp. BG]|nr:Acetyl-CoA:acetoacetyl-CoA transferase, alpha subunit [Desulfosporosinus sp. BG]
MKKAVLTADEAVALIKDGSMVAIDGFVSIGHPEELTVALEKRFMATGQPRNLSLVYAAGQGDSTAKKVIFCGTFTANGLGVEVQDGKLEILQEGKIPKLVKNVEHITFSGSYARKKGQKVWYVTERAVFALGEQGLVLEEIAPGVDLEKDILARMDFKPIISESLKFMDAKLFHPELMKITEDLNERCAAK